MRNTLSILLLMAVGVTCSGCFDDRARFNRVHAACDTNEESCDCNWRIENCALTLTADDSCCDIPKSYCDIPEYYSDDYYGDDDHYDFDDVSCGGKDFGGICNGSSGASNDPNPHHGTTTGGCEKLGCPKESQFWKQECAKTGCSANVLKDTYCDVPCNNIKCKFDGGDCPTPTPSPTDTHHTHLNHLETERTWSKLDVNHDGIIEVGEGGNDKINKQLIDKIESLDGDNSNDNSVLTKMEVDHAFQLDVQNGGYPCPYDDDFSDDGCRWSAAAAIRAVALSGSSQYHDGELPSSPSSLKSKSESASLHSIQHDQHDQQWKLVGSLCGSGLVVLAAAIVVIVHRRKAIAASAPAIKSISLTPPTSLI